MPSSSYSYAAVGDAANAVSLASTLLFALAVVLDSAVSSGAKDKSVASPWSLFDTTWKDDGFCVTNRDVPYQNSHDWCLYVDTALIALIAAAYYGRCMPRLPSSMKDVDQLFQLNLFASAAHGMAHGGFAAAIRNGDVTLEDKDKSFGLEWLDGSSNDTPKDMLKKFLPGVVFWIFFLKVIIPKLRKSYIFVAAWFIHMASALLPIKFGFTYTQTVILALFSINQMLRPVSEKQFAYASLPIITAIPTTLVGWAESTMCTRGVVVRDVVYGHVLYDVYTIVSMVVWYYVCAAHTPKNVSALSAKKLA